MNIGAMSANTVNSAQPGSLQQGFAVSSFKNSLDFNKDMVNQLISGGAEVASQIQNEAMNAQGKGLNVNITV